MRQKLMVVTAAAALAVCWPATAGATTGWVPQPTPLPHGVRYGLTTAVSCATARACTAVGFDNNLLHGTRRLLAEQWTGGAWTIRRTAKPAGFTGGALDAVSCVTPARCLAVGVYGTGPSTAASLPLAESWNGSTWALQPIPVPQGSIRTELPAVSCTAAASCTAVGDTESSAGAITPLAEHWNGSTWAIQPAPGAGLLTGISCTGPAACMAAGITAHAAPLAERWDGRAWTLLPMPSPAKADFVELTAVSCASAALCHADGFFYTRSSLAMPLAEAWNGRAWTIQRLPRLGRTAYLTGISCPTATSCTAVGGGGVGGLAEVWNGSTWTQQLTYRPTPNKVFYSVSCVAARTCTAVGNSSRTQSLHTAQPLTEHE